MNNKRMKIQFSIKELIIISGFCLVVFLSWAGARIQASIHYDQQIGNYVTQAGHATTPEIAIERFDLAIAHAKEAGLTQGNTGILWQLPENDIGFWYNKLVDSRNVLQALPKNDSALEVSNTMMRVRESLVGQLPDGIEVYPNQIFFAAWGWLSGLSVFFFLGCALYKDLRTW